jgi:hypothetical protein
MTWPLFLLPTATGVVLAFYWWRACRRRSRARQAQIEALIQVRLDGMQARRRLARYQVLAHQAIEAEVQRARRELPGWWSLYD